MRPCPLIAMSLLLLACDKKPAPTPPDAADSKAETKAETKSGTEADAKTVAREQGQPIAPPPGLTVPLVTASLDPVPEGPVVYVTRNDLSVGDEKLVALLDGQLDPGAVKGKVIGLLYQRLLAHVEQAQQAATSRGEPWEEPMVVVVADSQLPYSTMLDVLYTANRAQLTHYAFVAESEPGVYGSIPVEPPRFAEPEAEPLMVVIDSNGFEVRDQTQPTAEPDRIPVQTGKLYGAWDFEAVGQRAQQYRERQPTARSAAVSPSEDTRWGVVLGAYAALRGTECATKEESCVLPKLTALSPGTTSHSNTRQPNTDPSPGSGAGFGGRGKKVPQVQQIKADVTGALSPDIVRRIVRAHLNEVRSCYDAALRRNPAAEGRLEVSFEITAAGSVEGAAITDSALADDGLNECVVKAVGGWKFPKPTDGKTVEVRYPFMLSQG